MSNTLKAMGWDGLCYNGGLGTEIVNWRSAEPWSLRSPMATVSKKEVRECKMCVGDNRYIIGVDGTFRWKRLDFN